MREHIDGWLPTVIVEHVLFGHDTATMEVRIFEALPVMDTIQPRLPTGVMWRYAYTDFTTGKKTWYARWYVVIDNIQRVFSRKIIVADWRALAGIK